MSNLSDADIQVGNSVEFQPRFVESLTGAAIDISTATTKQVLIRKPDGVLLTKDASFLTDGTNGYLSWTASDELDLSGQYYIQGYVIMPSGTFYSSTDKFRVKKNLSGTVPE